jgi:hypothetical protein
MIGPVIVAALPLLRANAESLMTDTCDIERLTTVWDEEEQTSVTTWAPVHTDTPCHVESPPVTVQSLLTEELVSAETPVVKVSYLLDGIEPDDRVTVAGGDVMWVTSAAPDDSTHPVEMVIQCRWTR